jgi:hypothetical protein
MIQGFWWNWRVRTRDFFCLLPRVYRIEDTYNDVICCRWLWWAAYRVVAPRWRNGERV